MSLSKTTRLFWIVGVILLAVSMGGGAWMLNSGKVDGLSGVGGGGSPASKSGELAVTAFGWVDGPNGLTKLYPLQPGRVVAVPVPENQPVAADTTLVQFDDRVAQLRLREAEAALKEANVQLTQAEKLPMQQDSRIVQQQQAIVVMESRLKAAEFGLNRRKALLKINQAKLEDVLAEEELSKAAEAAVHAEKEKLRELRLNDPEAGIERAKADVAHKQALVDLARQGVYECVLKAPKAGIPLRILVSPGEVLGPQPTQPAVIFLPDGPRIVRAEVDQEFAGRVEIGQPAVIQDDTRASQSWHGRVASKSDWYTQRRLPMPEPFQFNDVRTLECIIELNPDQPPLHIGQRVRVTIKNAP